MWSTLGYDFDFEFANKIGQVSFELLYYFIEASVSTGKSLVTEAHFSPERSNQRINDLKKKFGTKILQIYCDCETETLQKRFIDRMENNPTYHAGHKHAVKLYGEERVLNGLGTKNKRLEIDDMTYDLDTTDLEKIDYQKVLEFIRSNS